MVDKQIKTRVNTKPLREKIEFLRKKGWSETEIVKYIKMNLIVDSVPVLEDEDVHIHVDLEGGIF